MDIATIVGFIAIATTLMVGIGSNLSTMLDAPSAIIVVGGTLAALLVSFPLRDIVGSTVTSVGYAFFPPMAPDEDVNAIFRSASKSIAERPPTRRRLVGQEY